MSALNRSTLQEQVFEDVRARILDGSLASGERLLEEKESARLGVSRGTLREALRQLEEQGLVTRDPRRFIYVRKLSPKEIQDIYRVRGALEVLAVQIVCETRNLADRIALAKTLREFAARRALAEESGSAAERIGADLGFHETLCEFSNNQILLEQYRQLAALIRVMLSGESERLSAGWSSRPPSASQHHYHIADAIEHGDVAQGSKLILDGFKRSTAFLTGSPSANQQLNASDDSATSDLVAPYDA